MTIACYNRVYGPCKLVQNRPVRSNDVPTAIIGNNCVIFIDVIDSKFPGYYEKCRQ